jgi:hypothetical protein
LAQPLPKMCRFHSGDSIMRHVLVFVVTLVASSGALAQTSKQLIAACVDRELAKVRTTEPFALEGGVTCRAGEVRDFTRCDRQDKDQTVAYTARDGYVISAATMDVKSKTGRGSVGAFAWNDKSASVPISCRGNGCDKGDREWSRVKISGTLQRIPTEEDRTSAMNRCLDEVLK